MKRLLWSLSHKIDQLFILCGNNLNFGYRYPFRIKVTSTLNVFIDR